MLNGAKIPWFPRLLAESAAIVASILLAFAINAWWSDSRDRAEERNILLSLQAEFEQNLAIIDPELSYRQAVIDSILKIFDAAAGDSSLEPAVLDELIGDVTWWANAVYFRGAIEGLVQSGKLSLIADEQLRQQLASMPSSYDLASNAELYDEENARNVINPFLSANGSLSQIANTMSEGRPGTGQGQTPPVYPARDRVDHSHLLGNEEFLGILVREHWDHLDAIGDLQNLRMQIEQALILIESSLNR